MSLPIKLENSGATAHVCLGRGGLIRELSLIDQSSHGESKLKKLKQILWMPPDFKETGSGWPGGGCPVLFPFAGRVWNQEKIEGKWNYEEVEYPMPIHGFAYSRPMQIINQSTNKLHIGLESDPVSRSLYPFDFSLELTYRLERNALEVGFSIFNGEKKSDLPVALGFHPYFKIGSQEGAKVELGAKTRYRVHTNGDVSRPEHFEDEVYSCLNDKIQNAIFADFDRAASLDFGDGTVLKIEQSSEFPFRTVWSPPNSEFYCLEPWMALPNAPNLVDQKVGAQLLEPGKTMEGSIRFELLS